MTWLILLMHLLQMGQILLLLQQILLHLLLLSSTLCSNGMLACIVADATVMSRCVHALSLLQLRLLQVMVL